MIREGSIRFQSWFIAASPAVIIVTANTPCIDNASSKLVIFRDFRRIATVVVASIQQNVSH